VPGGSGDDAGWRGLLAAILSRAAAPAKLPLCTTFAKTRIPIIKLSRIIYAVLALLSTTAAQPPYSRNHGVVRNPISQPLWGWKRWRCDVSTFGKSLILSAAFLTGVAIAANADPLCCTPTGPCRPPGPQIATLPLANVTLTNVARSRRCRITVPTRATTVYILKTILEIEALDGITIPTMTMTTTVNPSLPKTGTTAPIPQAITPT
jgi:hypothetical protein